MALLTVNGAELYYKVRGSGPPVLLIMGFTGDSGHFATLAELLADQFTVVSYDRRGNGRSPRPAGWATTSPQEQADDAAALLATLGLAPAAVYGTSAGGNFTLCLLVRHPDVVCGAVLHEPVLVPLFDDPGARGALAELVRQGMEAGGPVGAQERLFRWLAEDANWERLQPDLRERMRATADTFFDIELGSYEGFLPDDASLAAITVPVMVLVSTQSHGVYAQAAGAARPAPGRRGHSHARHPYGLPRPPTPARGDSSTLPSPVQRDRRLEANGVAHSLDAMVRRPDHVAEVCESVCQSVRCAIVSSTQVACAGANGQP